MWFQVSYLPYWWTWSRKWDTKTTYLIELLAGSNRIVKKKCLSKYLAHSKYTIDVNISISSSNKCFYFRIKVIRCVCIFFFPIMTDLESCTCFHRVLYSNRITVPCKKHTDNFLFTISSFSRLHIASLMFVSMYLTAIYWTFAICQ